MEKAGTKTFHLLLFLNMSSTNNDPLEVIGDSVRCERAARKDGMIFAICGLFVSGYFSHKILKLSRNASMVAAFSASSIAGYMFSKASFQQCQAKALRERQEKAKETFLQ
jgi:hypothetical protein